MSRVTPLPPPASTASAGVDDASTGVGDEDASTGVGGKDDDGVEDDDDGVKDDDDASVVAEEGDSSASPPSSWSPPPDMADIWKSLVGLPSSSSGKWEPSTRLGPSTSGVIRRWGSSDSGFSSLSRDPCLHTTFDKYLKESKALLDLAFSSMASSSAAAHALSHASAYVDEFVRRLATVSAEPGWASFCAEAEKAISDNALLPLRDASRCLAGIYGRSTSTIRAGVIRHADPSIQSVLRSSPPSSEFFFGDPAAQVSSSMNLAVISTLIQSQRAPASRGYFRRPGAYSRGGASAAASSSTSSSPSSSKSKGKGSGRSSRGKGGGRK